MIILAFWSSLSITTCIIWSSEEATSLLLNKSFKQSVCLTVQSAYRIVARIWSQMGLFTETSELFYFLLFLFSFHFSVVGSMRWIKLIYVSL